MTSYWLHDDAHVCVCRDHLVILDATRGKYLGLPLAEARLLAPWIAGWPVAAPAQTPDPNAPPVLRRLLDQGLLTHDAARGKPATPVSIAIHDSWYGDRRPRQRAAIELLHRWRFLRSVAFAATAMFLMRWRLMKLERLIERARRRKSRGNRPPLDVERLLQLMTIYGYLRPYLYTREDACLLHSLAVLEYLACYEIFPDWVLAVRTMPFQAHSWLQIDGQLLTDSPLYVSRLTPILRV